MRRIGGRTGRETAAARRRRWCVRHSACRADTQTATVSRAPVKPWRYQEPHSVGLSLCRARIAPHAGLFRWMGPAERTPGRRPRTLCPYGAKPVKKGRAVIRPGEEEARAAYPRSSLGWKCMHRSCERESADSTAFEMNTFQKRHAQEKAGARSGEMGIFPERSRRVFPLFSEVCHASGSAWRETAFPP